MILLRSLISFCSVSCILFASLTISAQNFTADVSEGCAPLHVKFSTTATGNYAWTFGKANNNTSNIREPEVTYDTPGNYTVTLSVDGAPASTKVAFIKVYQVPSPDFDLAYNPGCAPVGVQFTNTSTSVPEVPITTYQWIYGDGATDVNPQGNVNHTYNSSGQKTVTLLAKNDNMPGCVNAKVKTAITVLDIQAKFSVPTFYCAAPASAQFTNTSTGPGQLSYLWDIGGLATSTDVSPGYTFADLGSYKIDLTVKGDFGCTATASQTVNVGTSAFAIVADRTLICVNEEINFSVDQGAYLNPWVWDFGNGITPAPSLDQTVKYKDPGTYVVKLTAAAGSCNVLLTKKIDVEAMPVPSFSFEAECNRVISFKNTSTDAVSWLWDFGDGTTSTEKDPKHTYSAEGDYFIKLKAKNAAQCEVTGDLQAIHVYSNPVASISPGSDPSCTAPSLSGCAPLIVNFGNNTVSNIATTKVAWSFGDGRTSDVDNPIITYSTPGKYIVKLTITAAGGCNFTTQDTVTVYNPAQTNIPVISISKNNLCAGEEVNLKTSTSFKFPLCWELEPGVVTMGTDIKYRYANPGTHDIVLTVPGCSNQKTLANAITVNEPKVDYQIQNLCYDPKNTSAAYQVDFTNKSTNKSGLIYSWDFGDGTISTDRNPPRHTYPIKPLESLNYTVVLKVTDPSTFCEVTLTQPVRIQELKADFLVRGIEADNTDPLMAIKACKNNEIQFTDASPFAVSWQWYFADTSSPVEELYSHEQNPVKVYKTTGIYKVVLLVSDGVCNAIKEMALPITIPDVDGKFDLSAHSDCVALEVQFTDKSVSVPSASKWLWDFGNGDVSTEQNPKYTYTTKGSYHVKLTVGNNEGDCTIPLKDALAFTTPSADFSVNRPFACIGETLNFNQVTQYTNFVRWDFGNGIVSNAFSPKTSYAQTGTYPVTLWAKDYFGCEVQFSKSDFITITKPTADFQYDKTIKDCPPLITSFTDRSINAKKWSWNFGDGQTADTQNPINSFQYPGIYSVTLVVDDINGCSDGKTISDLIRVDGPKGVFTNLNTVNCTDDAIRFTSNYSEAVLVRWDFGDGKIEENMNSEVSHTYAISGKVQPLVILKDIKGCEVVYKTDKEILVYQSPQSDFKFIPKFPFVGENVTFTPDATDLDFSWSFSDGVTVDKDTATRVFNDFGSQTAILNMKDPATGCVTIVSKEVPVQGYPDLIPNVFTPNNDELNPTFEILGLEKSNWEFTVYNRWGNQVYKSGDYKNLWTGDDLSTGTYYFILRNKVRPEKKYVGDVTILR